MKIMTLKEVAERTRTPEATLRYWRHLGTQGPKSWTLGSRVVYAEAWIKAQCDAADTKVGG